MHNYLKQRENVCYVPACFVETEGYTETIIPCSWRCEAVDDVSAFYTMIGLVIIKKMRKKLETS